MSGTTNNNELATLADYRLDAAIAEKVTMINSALAGRERALEELEGCEKSAVLSAWALGKYLNEKKRRLDHGEWLPWLETTSLSVRSAQDYMRLAGQIRSAAYLKSSIAETLRGLPKPRQEPAPSQDDPPGPAMVQVRADFVEAHEKGIEEKDKAIEELTSALDEREERIAIMTDGLSAEENASIEKLNNDAALIKTQKGRVNELMAEIQNVKREKTHWKRRALAAEKRVEELEGRAA